jgi:DNA-directed RNA polymerase subunit M/transcription elongation factor TFIIS
MKCPKCDGLMLKQAFFNHFINFEGWKCLNCGKIVEKKENSIKETAFSIFYQRQKNKDQSDS